MTAPVSVSCSKQTKSLTQTGLRSISGIGTDRRACVHEWSSSRLLAQPAAIHLGGDDHQFPFSLMLSLSPFLLHRPKVTLHPIHSDRKRVDQSELLLFQPFQFFATRFGEASQRINCLCGDHWTEVSKCHIWLRV